MKTVDRVEQHLSDLPVQALRSALGQREGLPEGVPLQGVGPVLDEQSGERPDLLLDGEMIALNDRGTPDFRVLQHRMHVRNQAEVAKLVGRIPATFSSSPVLS